MPMRNGRVSGVVRGADNSTIPDARVELRDRNTGAAVLSTYTNMGGAFEFRDVPRGSYEVVATSGISEARERLELSMGDNSVSLRMLDRTAQSSVGGQQTVSVAAMKVPGKARNEAHKAQEDMQKNRLPEARKELLKALEIYPTFAEAYTLLGIIDLQENNPQDAAVQLEQAVKYDPNAPMSFVALGATYTSLGRYDDALRSLDSATRLSPTSWQAYLEIAKADLGKGDFQSALTQITKAEEYAVNRDFPPIHLIKAHALLGLKNYPSATTELEKYLSREPKGPNATEARQTLDQVKAFTGNK